MEGLELRVFKTLTNMDCSKSSAVFVGLEYRGWQARVLGFGVLGFWVRVGGFRSRVGSDWLRGSVLAAPLVGSLTSFFCWWFQMRTPSH